MDDNKGKALAAALLQIEQVRQGSIMKMGDAQIASDLSVVSTGSLGLDIALSVGGLPRGRVVEIYGPESSGKTTLCLQVVAQVQGGWRRGLHRRGKRARPVRRQARRQCRRNAHFAAGQASRDSRSRTCWCAPAAWT
jgi:hypothetical protein